MYSPQSKYGILAKTERQSLVIASLFWRLTSCASFQPRCCPTLAAARGLPLRPTQPQPAQAHRGLRQRPGQQSDTQPVLPSVAWQQAPGHRETHQPTRYRQRNYQITSISSASPPRSPYRVSARSTSNTAVSRSVLGASLGFQATIKRTFASVTRYPRSCHSVSFCCIVADNLATGRPLKS